MPEVVGTFIPPRLSSAPASPTPGQLYYDTTSNTLYYWNGTQWTAASGGQQLIFDSDQIGTIKAFSGATIPPNWLLADGRSLLRTDYPDLFNVISTVYGAADGTHFNLPDLRSRFIYGATTPAGNGGVGGAATHTLSAAEMPVHNHAAWVPGATYPNNYNTYAGVAGVTAVDRWNNTAVGNAGSGAAHNNLPPYILMAQIIKAVGAQIVAGAPVPPLVTSLPTNPVDGQECYYLADATNGIIFYLRYRAAAPGSYKWEFVGGSPLYAEVLTNESTGSATYTALATAGPAIALPLAGDYIVELGYNGNNMAAQRTYMSYDIGATGAVDADCAMTYGNANASMEATVARARRKNGLGAVTLTAKYRMSASTGWFQNRWMKAIPVRVG